MNAIGSDITIKLEESILSHFPDYKTEIQILIKEDDSFLELASDYLFCKKELVMLSASGKMTCANHYRQTLEHLREELMNLLRIQRQNGENKNK